MRLLPSLALASCFLATGCGKTPAPPPSTGTAPDAPSAATPTTGASPAKPASELAVGDAVPDVTFTMQDGKKVSLRSLAGKPVAIYFYPKDETTGCTIEAQGIRDNWAAMTEAGVVVVGVSTQDAESHKAFIAKEKLPYDLAVDTDESLAKAFGVPLRAGFAARQTFLVGKDGKLKKIWRDVKPQGHAEEIVAAAKS